MKSRLATSICRSFLNVNLKGRIPDSTLLALIVMAVVGAVSAPAVSSAQARKAIQVTTPAQTNHPVSTAQDVRGYSYGPVTLVLYIHVEYGRFDEYMAWVTSTWMPTMQAEKKAGLIIGYKVFKSEPKLPDQPNVYLEITFKNMAAYAGDIGDQADAFDAVTDKVICDSACQNQARVKRNEIRKVLGTEVIRELIFK